MLFRTLVLTELSEAMLLLGRVDEASTLTERLLDLFRAHMGSDDQAHAQRPSLTQQHVRS
jgi:hypothetical protein